jgi:uncharacterized membrane protein
MPETEPPPRSTGGPLAFVAFAVVFVVLVGGYFLFPWMLRTMSYADCIASGRITGC